MKNEKVIGSIDARIIAAASIWQAVNDVRYYLNGIMVEPHPDGGVVVVATDGHTLFVGRDESGHISAKTIFKFSPRFLTECKKKPATGYSSRRVELDGRFAFVANKAPGNEEPFYDTGYENLTPEAAPAVEPINTIDGVFPNYQRVIPEKTSPLGAPTTLNAEYLARLPKTASALGISNKAPYLTMFACGEKPSETNEHLTIYRFTAPLQETLILIMPCRGDYIENGIPEWIPRPDETKQENAA